MRVKRECVSTLESGVSLGLLKSYATKPLVAQLLVHSNDLAVVARRCNPSHSSDGMSRISNVSGSSLSCKRSYSNSCASMIRRIRMRSLRRHRTTSRHNGNTSSRWYKLRKETQMEAVILASDNIHHCHDRSSSAPLLLRP